MAEAHQALALVEGLLDVAVGVAGALDLLDHAEDAGGGAAVQRAGHGADGAREGGGDVGAGGGDDAGREGGRVHAVLGGGRPVGVDGRDVLGVGLAAPADHEAFDDGLGLVDLALRDHGQALAAGGLGDVRQGHDGGAGEVVAGLLVVDVEERACRPQHGGEHGERGLDVDADVAGVDRDRERLGGRQAGVEGAVDEQAPDVAEGDVADQVLDVDAAVAQGAALLVRFGDLRLERDDSFEPGYEVGHQAAPRDVCDRWCRGVCEGARDDMLCGLAVRFRGRLVDSRSGRHPGDAPSGWWSPNRTAAARYPRVPPLGRVAALSATACGGPPPARRRPFGVRQDDRVTDRDPSSTPP